jgi:sugar (pentulose or hexulose) kinase
MGLLALERHGVVSRDDLDRAAATTGERFEPDPTRHERYAYRQVQFEAAYAALLPISEALA